MTFYSSYSTCHSLCFQLLFLPSCSSTKTFGGGRGASLHLLFFVHLHGLIPLLLSLCFMTFVQWGTVWQLYLSCNTHVETLHFFIPYLIYFCCPISFICFPLSPLTWIWLKICAMFMFVDCWVPRSGSSAWSLVPSINTCFINEHVWAVPYIDSDQSHFSVRIKSNKVKTISNCLD